MPYRKSTALVRLAGFFLAIFMSAACGSVGAAVGKHAAASNVAAGERIYRQGIGTDGKPVQAFSQTDVPLSGEQAACVTCHRPSGLGSSEGGYYVPPISGPLLFSPRKLDRLRLFPQFFHQVQPKSFDTRLHQPHMRPGYTVGSLATTLSEGVDAAGQKLATIMPRYRMTDADVKALAAYLHTLSARIDPGVDDHQIKLAAVFSDQVPAADRDAMLGTLQAYVKWRNLHLHEDQSRKGFSPYSRSEFVPIERSWSLSVWTLKGDASTWRAQLDAYYRANPVFALVGGKVDGSWNGPSQFCDEHRIPCLFPDTDLPAWPPSHAGYTVYFSAGLALEAQVSASFIASHEAGNHAQVVQIAAADSYGQLPARIFQQTLHEREPRRQQSLITYHDRAELDAALKADAGHPDRLLVVWPGADVTTAVDALAALQPRASLVFLPSRAIDAARKAATTELAARLRFADPYELAPSSHVKSFETRAWLHTRHLVIDHPLLQFKEYYAMSMLDAALFEISNDFYRDYLIERIEDESQKDMNPGIYPRLALGPGERYAAKGANIVRFAPGKPSGLTPVGNWIAP
ncbi:MAG: cytochrome c [Xanthomonadaceae bacterium]|nr:cytochrome c [Xanthomonadaceae bacterium]